MPQVAGSLRTCALLVGVTLRALRLEDFRTLVGIAVVGGAHDYNALLRKLIAGPSKLRRVRKRGVDRFEQNKQRMPSLLGRAVVEDSRENVQGTTVRYRSG
jgi:hypothetical protein